MTCKILFFFISLNFFRFKIISIESKLEKKSYIFMFFDERRFIYKSKHFDLFDENNQKEINDHDQKEIDDHDKKFFLKIENKAPIFCKQCNILITNPINTILNKNNSFIRNIRISYIDYNKSLLTNKMNINFLNYQVNNFIIYDNWNKFCCHKNGAIIKFEQFFENGTEFFLNTNIYDGNILLNFDYLINNLDYLKFFIFDKTKFKLDITNQFLKLLNVYFLVSINEDTKFLRKTLNYNFIVNLYYFFPDDILLTNLFCVCKLKITRYKEYNYMCVYE